MAGWKPGGGGAGVEGGGGREDVGGGGGGGAGPQPGGGGGGGCAMIPSPRARLRSGGSTNRELHAVAPRQPVTRNCSRASRVISTLLESFTGAVGESS